MKSSVVQRISLIIADILSLLISLILAKLLLNQIRPGADNISLQIFGIAKFSGLLLILVFWYQEQYVKRRPMGEEIRLLFYTVFVFALFHLGFSYFLSHHVVKLLSMVFWLMLLIVLPIMRYITKTILYRLNLWQRGLFIIGTGENALSAYYLLTKDKLLGYKFLGFIDLKSTTPDNAYYNVIIGNEHKLPVFSIDKLFQEVRTDYEIVFALNSSQLLEHSKTINVIQAKYTFVSIVPDISGLPLYGVSLEHFFGSDQLFLRLQNNLSRRLNRIIKRISDIVLSVLGIICLSPVFIFIALSIKRTTGDKVIFKHKRVGIDGKHFYCMKFQTMYPNAQNILEHLLATDESARLEWQKDFKLKNDPRVTRIGRFLRKTSLDELPQLFNVIRGEMSLVGPRPIIDAELERYGEDAYYYKLVRPGVTGLWQISGRNDIDYASRIRLDVCYTKNWSLWYDFVILAKTVMVVFGSRGAY